MNHHMLLCRDIPGLKYTVESNKAGICVDTDDVSSVVEGIKKIESEYDQYSTNALSFYKSVDVTNLVEELISEI